MAAAERQHNTIFAVIDPTSEVQHALNKAVDIASTYGSRIHAYVGIYSRLETDDPEMLKRVETARYKMWLDTFIEPIRDQGIKIDEYIDWTPDWRVAMSEAARNMDSDLIIKHTSRRGGKSRVSLTSSDIALLEPAHCPVLLHTKTDQKPSYKILAAVDPKRTNERYRKLMESILEMGRVIESTHADEGAELHVVYSYNSSDNYLHVTDVAHATGMDPERVHIVSGKPEEAVRKVAAELDAYLVIIGLSTGHTVHDRLFGATSDWILNNIDRDLLVMT